MPRKPQGHYLLLMALTVWAMPACDPPFEHSRCKWQVVAEQPSPDQKHVAEVTEYSCRGEKAIHQTRVRVLRANTFPVVLEVVFAADGKQALKTTWLEPQHLLIECEGEISDKQSFKDEDWDNVKVSFSKC